MPQAHAYLGVPSAHHTFRFNPSQVNWGYKENTMSFDTIGGRVVQLLSVAVTDITVVGVAGSRDELQLLAENARAIMDYHVKTLRPVHFRVPSRQWDFRVYVNAMPQMGWDVAATTYPYQLTLAVEEDLTGVQSHKLESAALDRLVEGVGYNKSVHGGDPQAFQKIVKTVLSASAGVATVGSDTANNTPTETGPNFQLGARGYGSLEPWTSGPTTASVLTVIQEVSSRFDRVRGGTYNCRTTASGGFSQHCAGNAWDICLEGGCSDTPSYQAYYDEIYKFLKSNIGAGLRLPISQVIWRNTCSLGASCGGGYVSGHMNHIHVSGSPYQTRCVPGCVP